jgi:hypothetical protein
MTTYKTHLEIMKLKEALDRIEADIHFSEYLNDTFGFKDILQRLQILKNQGVDVQREINLVISKVGRLDTSR